MIFRRYFFFFCFKFYPAASCVFCNVCAAAVIGLLDTMYFAVKDLDGEETMSVDDAIVALLLEELRHLGLFLAVVREPGYWECLSMSDLGELGWSRTFMKRADFDQYEAVVEMAKKRRARQLATLGLTGADAVAKSHRDVFPAPRAQPEAVSDSSCHHGAASGSA